MPQFFLGLVVVLAGCFAFLNGFRDVSAAVAVAVRTRALTPSVAVLLAGLFNLVGALLSGSLALAVSNSWLILPHGVDGLSILVAGLVSAILWGTLTWWWGLPSSSTHALVGGLAGAGTASVLLGGPSVEGTGSALLTQIVLPLLISPVVAFVVAFLLVYPAIWLARHGQPNLLNRRFRRAQAVAATAVAFGHGLQDAQRTTAVILLALAAFGSAAVDYVPVWVQLLTAIMLTAGTIAGGWRISHTLGYRMVRVDPMRGVVSQVVSATLLFVGAIGLQLPLSTTHVVTASIAGTGTNQSFSVINRALGYKILATWLATPLVTILLGAVLALALSPLS